jgi:hypothetical protein
VDQSAFTIREWCERNRISRSLFYILDRRGEGHTRFVSVSAASFRLKPMLNGGVSVKPGPPTWRPRNGGRSLLRWRGNLHHC